MKVASTVLRGRGNSNVVPLLDWTRNLYRDYPYDPKDRRESLDWEGNRVVRGGSWATIIDFARCAVRLRDVPDYLIYGHLGFRVVVVAAPVP